MDETELPMEIAKEPNEEAHQPELEIMHPTPNVDKRKPRRLHVAFESAQSTELTSSQNSSKAYKEELSQPPAAFSHRQRLQWLQARRQPGLWAQCDSCSQWRYLPHVLDRHELPQKWYCSLNPDKSYANCSVPESPIQVRDEEDLIHSEYSAGSVVWARLSGWPWWPAMVDDCPDTEQYYWIDGFSDIPTHYNVVFFDASSVTRSWVEPYNLKPYGPHKQSLKSVVKDRRFSKRLEVAVRQANEAEQLPLANRLARYSFIARYPGSVNPPKNIRKKYLKIYKTQLKRKYNIDFPDESGAGSEEETDNVAGKLKQKVRIIKKNGILVGTPKAAKHSRTSNKDKVDTVSSTKDTAIDNTETADYTVIEIVEDQKSPEKDTSKTYVPDSENETESTIKETLKNIRTHLVSPNSDDFDF